MFLTMNNLARSYLRLNRHAEALKLCEEALAAQKRVLPPDHPMTLSTMDHLGNCYAALNRQVEALKLREETLAARKRVSPHDHPDTLSSVANLAQSYVALNREAEALRLIDEVLTKGDWPGIDQQAVRYLIAQRFQCYQKLGDLAGSRTSAEMLEKRYPTDASSLYNAACCRAVCAALQAKSPGVDAARLAEEHANKAMAWLTKAVAAGFEDAVHMNSDTDLDFLRDREAFKKLQAKLDANSPKPAESTPPEEKK
jgi:tetratricopeptide (TPR) repeat protein